MVLAALPGDRTAIDALECGSDAAESVVGRMPEEGAVPRDPRFGFPGADKCGGLARGGLAPARGRCAATRARRREMPGRSPGFEPALGACRAEEMRKGERPLGIRPRIKGDLALSTYSDIGMEPRAAFVEQYVLPEIGQGALGGGGTGGS